MNKKFNRKKHTPIRTIEDDILNLDSFIECIELEILQSFSIEDNYAIGIVSNWGDGKTSVINLLIEKLLKKSKILKLQVFFHIILILTILVLPSIWGYFYLQNIIKFFTEHLIVILGIISLFSFVSYRRIYDIFLLILGKIKKIYNKRNIVVINFSPWNLSNIKQIYTEYLNTLAKELDTSSYQISSLLLLYAETFLQKDLSFLNKHIKAETSIEELKTRITKILKNAPYKIIVIIDDVDRIKGIEIYNLFKLIGSVANFPNIVNLIAYDKHYVCTELSNYLDKEKNSISNANQYLKKIVNKEFMLPKINGSKLYEIFSNELKSIIENTNLNFYNEKELKYNYLNTIGFYIKNIRDIKQLLNAFEAHYSVFKKRGININIIDLLFITTLRVFNYELWLNLHDYMKKQDYNIGGLNFTTDTNNNEINFYDFNNLEFENKNIIATLIRPEYRGCSPIDDRHSYDIKRFGRNIDTTNLYFEFNPPYSNMGNIIKEITSENINIKNIEKYIKNEVDSSDFYDLLFSKQYRHLLNERSIFNIIEFILTTNQKIRMSNRNFIIFFEREQQYIKDISVEKFTNYLLELAFSQNIDINIFICIVHGYFIYSSSNDAYEKDIQKNEIMFFEKLSNFILSRLYDTPISIFDYDNLIHLISRFSKYDKAYSDLIIKKVEQQIQDIDNYKLLDFIMKYKEITYTSDGEKFYFDSFMEYICPDKTKQILLSKLLAVQKNEEIMKNNNYITTYRYPLNREPKETHLVDYLIDTYLKDVNVKPND